MCEGIVDSDIDLSCVYFDNTHYRATLGGIPSLADVDKLVNRVRKFRELCESEAAWIGYIDTTLFLTCRGHFSSAGPHDQHEHVITPSDPMDLPIRADGPTGQWPASGPQA
jgi:hypothetical protein